MVRHGCTTLEECVDVAYKTEVTLEESARKTKGMSKPSQQGSQFSGFKRLAPPPSFKKLGRSKT